MIYVQGLKRNDVKYFRRHPRLWRLFALISLIIVSMSAGNALAAVDTERLEMKYEIEPVRALQVQADSGTILRFGPLVPNADMTEQILSVSIATNELDAGYRIYQELPYVTSSQGNAFPKTEVLMWAEDGKEGGVSQIKSPVPAISKKKILIFVSSKKGGPDSFRIHYRVPNQSIYDAGRYLGNVRIILDAK
ncbi:MAG: hypothetical protein A2Z83_01630 [Omnitrophica bacterium GWA2_52_8]|nr:MAG: hypothetical protein A2Z83_01630 [Omnitrophica bacterium GWA2_52_8]